MWQKPTPRDRGRRGRTPKPVPTHRGGSRRRSRRALKAAIVPALAIITTVAAFWSITMRLPERAVDTPPAPVPVVHVEPPAPKNAPQAPPSRVVYRHSVIPGGVV